MPSQKYQGPYRTAAGRPIQDGIYEDLGELARELRRASQMLGLPVRSADAPKTLTVGFEVGSHRWTIHWRKAVETCPEPLQGYITTATGRALLARSLGAV